MKIPYRLRRIAEARPMVALLLPGHDSAALLRLLEELQLDSAPQIFAVDDGFLLRLPSPPRAPFAGVVRLGELATNLLLPVDAELTPMLLPDEASVLTRNRGLVFLPHERVLEFRLQEIVPLSSVLGASSVEHRAWQAPREPLTLANRLNEIVLDLPEPPPDTILDVGGAGIGEEEPRPEDSPLPRKLLGQSAMGLGKGLSWLGKMLHLNPLSRLGAKLMAGAAALAPRLNEVLLGKQEAGLRELLKQFREGNVEEALRRALPLTNEPGRGTEPHAGTSLPVNDPRYSLANILTSGGGSGRFWVSSADLFRELQNEYRKQAEAATRQGDYRRAAFIYGKLLADYRMAAAVLAQGGLHHDAALIYLKQLDDPIAAAQAFEAAGVVDRALQLYRQRGDHVRAGDLLRRMGEDESALAEYVQAADELVRSQGHCSAGDLLLKKAQRADLARDYFEAGWRLRPEGSPVPCATRLAQMFAECGDAAPLLRLVSEAEDYFTPSGNAALAGGFFNHLAALSQRPELAEVQEELRDRALLGLANKLRQGQQSGSSPALLTSTFLGAGTIWQAPLVSDAQFALKAAPAATRVQKGTTVAIRADIPTVRAVCHAAGAGMLFVGFASGEVACYELESGRLHYLDGKPGPIHSLAASADGRRLVVLYSLHTMRELWLASFVRDEAYRLVENRLLGAERESWLCPLISDRDEGTALLWDGGGDSFQVLRGPRLLVEHRQQMPGPYLCAQMPPRDIDSQVILAFNGRELTCTRLFQDRPSTQVPCAFPALTRTDSLAHAQVSLLGRGPGRVELAGIGEEGTLSWLDLDLFASQADTIGFHSRCARGPFQAVACVRAGLVAAVAADAIVWLRVSDGGIREQSRQPISARPAVACFPHYRTGELALITACGTIVRV